MGQYDNLVIKSGIPTIIGTDTLRADRGAHAGLTTTGLASGDVVQVSGALTLQKAVNTSTSPIIGIYDGVSGSVVKEGVVVATFSGSCPAAGSAVYLSSTAGQLTGTKPTMDMLHEIGMVVDATSSRILLQQKPVIALPPTPPVYIFVGSQQRWIAKFSAADGSYLGKYDCTGTDGGSVINDVLYDGAYVWGGQGLNSVGYIGKIDPVTGAQIGTPFSNFDPISYGMTFDGVNYWWGGYSTQAVTKFDVDGNVLGTVSFPGTYPWIVRYDGVASVWVTGWGHDSVTKVRVADNAKIASYSFPSGYWSPENESIVSDKTYVYLTLSRENSYDWMIYRIKISDGTTTQFPQDNYYHYPRGVVFDGANLWVKCSSNQTGTRLIKIRASDGVQLGTYDLSGCDANGGLCCDGDNIWVVRYPSSSIRKIRCSDGEYLGDYGDVSQIPSPSGICSTGGVLPWP
jgi:hypothetical protein